MDSKPKREMHCTGREEEHNYAHLCFGEGRRLVGLLLQDLLLQRLLVLLLFLLVAALLVAAVEEKINAISKHLEHLEQFLGRL
jgi:hypothetical protein